MHNFMPRKMIRRCEKNVLIAADRIQWIEKKKKKQKLIITSCYVVCIRLVAVRNTEFHPNYTHTYIPSEQNSPNHDNKCNLVNLKIIPKKKTKKKTLKLSQNQLTNYQLMICEEVRRGKQKSSTISWIMITTGCR